MAWISTAEIAGFRGFGATPQSLRLALPNTNRGSGLTFIVGPNNGGKSSVLEAIKLTAAQQIPEFTRGMRNARAGGVIITIDLDDGASVTVRSMGGGYHSVREPNPGPLFRRVYYVPPRREFDPQFSGSRTPWEQHAGQSTMLFPNRSQFAPLAHRLMDISEDATSRGLFDDSLRSLLGYDLGWTIDKEDNGNHVLILESPTGSHTSDGAGFGILSALYLADAFAAQPEGGSILIIDEPEVSLHPQLQGRLLEMLLDRSRTQQIIVGTHSPRLIDISAIAEGAQVARVALDEEGSEIHQLRQETCDAIGGALNDLHNPHWFGLEAREIFFADGHILVTEGQEDVLVLPRVCAARGKTLEPSLYGWGAGGADRMELVCEIVRDLGLRRVTCLVDGDKAAVADNLREQFPDFRFLVLSADDIRDKPERPVSLAKAGLCDSQGVLHDQYAEAFNALVDDINRG